MKSKKIQPHLNSDNQPPDLDEMINDLKNKINRFFNKPKNKSWNNNNGDDDQNGNSFKMKKPKFDFKFALIPIIGLILFWFLMSFYTVKEQEKGIALRLGKYESTLEPGLNWKPYFVYDIYKVNVTQIREISHRGLMLTKDENIVEVEFKVQYVVNNPKNFLLVSQTPEDMLSDAADSAVRHVVGSATMDDVLTEGREQVAVLAEERTQKYIDSYSTGLKISKINIENTQAPKAVQEAFDDVIKAREDNQRFINNSKSYENGIIPEARGNAQRLIQESLAYKEKIIAVAEGEAARFNSVLKQYLLAPEVTRKRMYIETLEYIYQNNPKLVITANSGNQLVYLPIQDLIGQMQKNRSIKKSGNFDKFIQSENLDNKTQDSSINSKNRNSSRLGVPDIFNR